MILDLFSRAVVGRTLGPDLSASLPLKALDRAVRRCLPSGALLHHSDRGCPYTSAAGRSTLEELGVTVSMSRKGNRWDNAVAESFFATLKTELAHRQAWATRIELRAANLEHIEVFYHRRRLHSVIGYRTPKEVEDAYALASAT